MCSELHHLSLTNTASPPPFLPPLYVILSARHSPSRLAPTSRVSAVSHVSVSIIYGCTHGSSSDARSAPLARPPCCGESLDSQWWQTRQWVCSVSSCYGQQLRHGNLHAVESGTLMLSTKLGFSWNSWIPLTKEQFGEWLSVSHHMALFWRSPRTPSSWGCTSPATSPGRSTHLLWPRKPTCNGWEEHICNNLLQGSLVLHSQYCPQPLPVWSH